MENIKHGLTVRGDSEYCPLPVSIESYWWCEPNCLHCFFRGLNHVWGSDLRPVNPEALERKLRNGLKNTNPSTPLAWALHHKKTIRVGNKADPFQPVERELKVSSQCMVVLRKLRWTHVVQTRFTDVLMDLNEESIKRSASLGLVTILPVISPGFERDWDLFELRNTPHPETRLKHIKKWIKQGVPVGVNGEPFIPGFHTVADFEQTVIKLREAGVKSYNTYNFHFTPHVAKRIVNVPGVDIERIWEMNQDREWRKIQQQLIDISLKHNIILGCPDFVNSGWGYVQQCNTCCGITVPNPCTFNSHHFKLGIQEGLNPEEVEQRTWDGSCGYETGKNVLCGAKNREKYTLKDILK